MSISRSVYKEILRLALGELRDSLANLSAHCEKIRTDGCCSAEELCALVASHDELTGQAEQLLLAYLRDDEVMLQYLSHRLFEIDLAQLLQALNIGTGVNTGN